jgi:ankyrin repeat protein
LQDIGNQNWEYAHRLLQCVAVAVRPLRVEELADFLAFDFDTESSPIFREDWRSEDPAYAVRSTCSSLLAIVDVGGSQVIQFAHFSVKECLMSKRLREAKDTISCFYVSNTPAHTVIAHACLGVLLHLNENVTKRDLKTFPLANYAAQHWFVHAQFEDVSLSPKIQNLVRSLFDPTKHHLSVWVFIYDPIPSSHHFNRSEHPPQPRAPHLHYAASTGIEDVVEFLVISHSRNVKSRCLDNKTALSIASQMGHSKVARFLLEHGADMEIRDSIGWGPLRQASSEGHVEVVQLLLEFGADVEAKNQYNNNALMFASVRGHLAVVRVLLEHGANVKARVYNNMTPLHFASEAGVAQILLQYETDADACDDGGWTPLHHASKHNRVEVAKLLLQHGAEVNHRDSNDRTPLHLATQHDVVQLLLEHGAKDHRME